MSSINATSNRTAVMTPGVVFSDPMASSWLAQATLRLRREVAWCWHQRAQCHDPGDGTLPPATDPTADSLNLVCHEQEKQHFFAYDVTAHYLTEEIDRSKLVSSCHESCWDSVAKRLNLSEAAQFVLALAAVSTVDAGLAAVFATCMNDLSRSYPTLALAQRLWDDPLAIIDCGDVGHPIYRYGFLSSPGAMGSRVDWYQPIVMPTLVCRSLLHDNGLLPNGLSILEPDATCVLTREGSVLADRLAAQSTDAPQIVPLIGPKGTEFAA